MLYVQFIRPLLIKHTQVSRETDANPSETIRMRPPDQYHRLLIGQFYTSRHPDIPIKVLENEHFQVTSVKDESEFIIELQSKHYSIVWVLSSSTIYDKAFIPALTDFHGAGGAILPWLVRMKAIEHSAITRVPVESPEPLVNTTFSPG